MSTHNNKSTKRSSNVSQLLIGIARTWIVCALAIPVMMFTGDWPRLSWLVILSAVVVPFYFVWSIWFRKQKE